MTRGSLKKSNPELKMRKLAKANRKSRSRSREQRSRSKNKRMNEKLEQARKNIKARMFEHQAEEKYNGVDPPRQDHPDQQASPNELPEPTWAATVDYQPREGCFRELVDDYQCGQQHGNVHVQHLGSSLGADGQPYAMQHHSTPAPGLKTDSS